ncbi:MAG: hypothetical protein D6788_00820 [Planctomycetota bacterium]|nr:MAG: hypothetical protein D6788_00820 [Planctomycetota bacterium]
MNALLLASLFITGVPMTGGQRLAMMVPLCLSVAVVYKTTRCENLREVPVAALVLCVTILFGMYAVGLGLFLLFKIMV